jgi:asparagine synthase (glutamine-hydrolysing)
MCGIAGLISLDSDRYIAPMLKAIEHRGRDDEGSWTSAAVDDAGRSISLGHRRLAIIDISPAGHQPMISRDGRFVLTFNGEIYNYRELREQLKAKGHTFLTDTDTEVLLTAFSEWGVESLPRLNGMFAFVVWDTKERALTLARDRVGIKPLYYALVPSMDGRPETFAFASEIKAILATGLVERTLDPAALHQYLTFLWTPDPHTLFRGIQKLPPAHYLILKDNQLTIHEWWDISYDHIEEGKSDEWWQERVLETLDRVVDLEMVADVPLGSFLSGGIDSSGIVAMMKNHSNGQKVSTYTIGFKPEDLQYDIIPDDVGWARKANKILKTENHEIMLAPDVARVSPRRADSRSRNYCQLPGFAGGTRNTDCTVVRRWW